MERKLFQKRDIAEAMRAQAEKCEGVFDSLSTRNISQDDDSLEIP